MASPQAARLQNRAQESRGLWTSSRSGALEHECYNPQLSHEMRCSLWQIEGLTIKHAKHLKLSVGKRKRVNASEK